MAPLLQSTNNNIVHIPYDVHLDVDRSLSENILEKLKQHADKIAQIDSHSGKTETFSQLLNRSLTLAQALKRKGVTTEDIVAICCYNNMDYIVVIIASIFIGSRFCAMDITAPIPSIIHCIKLTAPKLMFCEQEHEDLLDSVINQSSVKCEIITFDKTDKFVSISDLVELYRSEEKFEIDMSRKMKDTGCISFTSGTSGLSKGAQLSNFGLYYGAMIGARIFERFERSMIISLPYWVSNLLYCMVSIYCGTIRVIYRSFDLNTVVKVIQDFKVNNTVLPQHIMLDLIKNPEVCRYDTSCLKIAYFGGSKIGPNLIKEISKLFPHSEFQNAFGMTEMASLVMLSAELIMDENENYSVGRPIPGVQYKIADITTGECLGPNIKGELRIKYDGIMNGYLYQPDATAQAFDEDGYFKTGDILYYDNNYNFFLVDRLKEIFKFRAFHVSPVVIEEVLVLHPDVQDCAVIPVPHEHDGELPMAIVVPVPNSKITEQDMIQRIKECLADPYQLRGGVKFMDSIPRTSSGKIKRIYLRDLVLKKN